MLKSTYEVLSLVLREQLIKADLHTASPFACNFELTNAVNNFIFLGDRQYQTNAQLKQENQWKELEVGKENGEVQRLITVS